MAIASDANQQFGIKESNLNVKLAPYTDRRNVKRIVKKFFSQHVVNEADIELLNVFNVFLRQIKTFYRSLFALFAHDDDFQWTNKDAVTVYLNQMKAWIVEEVALMKKAKTNKKKKDDVETTQDDEPQMKRPERKKTKLESDFENFINVVVADFQYWNKIIKPINDLIKDKLEYDKRFGSPPSFDKGGIRHSAVSYFSFGSSSVEKSIEQAQHLLKIYFIAKTILTYNKHLYICNTLMLKEQDLFPVNLPHDEENNFQNFLFQFAQNRVPLGSD